MKRTVTLLSVALLTLLAHAQQQHTCSAHEITQRHLDALGQPEGLQTYASNIAHSTPSVQKAGGVLTVPIVVHVVWNTSAENIPDATIFNMVTKLNQDYSATNSDLANVRAAFTGDIANAQIEFCLAQVDPFGAPTTGITRTNTTETWFDPDFETDDMKSAPKGIDAWDPTRYLNIWVCDISSGMTGGFITLGYAYLPVGGVVGSWIDGLVLDYNYGIGGSARTATHEIGHYLGLLHPWGSGSGSCSADDGFSDTPNTDSPTYDCSPSNLMKCGVLTQYENFMDYSNCEAMFTNAQANYMNGILTGVRSSLLNNNLCSTAPGGCDAEPTTGTSDGDFIDGVVLGSINNTGTGSNGGPTYNDYTAQSTDLERGTAQSITITGGDYAPDNYAAWIDWNQDGDWDDANEKLGEFATTTSAETQNIAFTVPASATLGATTMRVRCVYDNSPLDPCTNYVYGETEDYSINVTAPGGPCIPVPIYGTNDGDFIDGVVLESINNTGSGVSGGASYHDYTAQSTDLERDANYSIALTSGDYNQDDMAAWIDWNQDGDWDDAGEKLGEFTTSTSFETQNINFMVPTTATLGQAVLRVRCVWNNSPLDPCTDYEYGETEDYTVNIVAPSTGGCIPMPIYGTDDGDFIDGVELESISNLATGATAGPSYNDYTAMNTDLSRGSNYDISITSGAYDTDDIAAWIDWNQDGDWDDAGEKLGEFSTSTVYETQNINFTVPQTATLGTTTMRVRCAWNSSPMDPCEDYGYGETEDYSVNITISTGVLETGPSDLLLYPVPASNTLNLELGNEQVQGVRILDLQGRMVLEVGQVSHRQQIDIQVLSSGMYVLQMEWKGNLISRRFEVQRQ